MIKFITEENEYILMAGNFDSLKDSTKPTRKQQSYMAWKSREDNATLKASLTNVYQSQWDQDAIIWSFLARK